MRIDESSRRYFDYLKSNGQVVRIGDIRNQDSEEMKKIKEGLKEWMETPAAKLQLSHEAKAIAKQKMSFSTTDAKEEFKGVDTSGYSESQKREIEELEEYIKAQGTPETRRADIRNALNDNTNPFIEIADEFRKTLNEPGMKLSLYEYSDGLDADHIRTDVIDRMEEQYQDLKKGIQNSFNGPEREEMLKRLDDSFNNAFEQKIIDPIARRLEDRLSFFKPEEEGHTQSRSGYADREGFEDIMSRYIQTERLKRSMYPDMEASAEKFLDLAGNTSSWHDTEKIKSVLMDTAKQQDAIISVPKDNSRLAHDKEWADRLAKEISDKYNKEHSLDKEEKGFISVSEGRYFFSFENLKNLDDLIGIRQEKKATESRDIVKELYDLHESMVSRGTDEYANKRLA